MHGWYLPHCQYHLININSILTFVTTQPTVYRWLPKVETIKSSKMAGTTPHVRRPHNQSVETSVFVPQNTIQSGFRRRPRPAEPKVPRYANPISWLWMKPPDTSHSNYLFKWTLLENSLHLTCIKTQTSRGRGPLKHTTQRSHNQHSCPPASSADAIHIKFTLTKSVQHEKHTPYSIQIRVYKQDKSSQHSTTVWY